MNLTSPLSPPVKIVVVDDHPNTAALLARAISQLNPKVEVVAATSGLQALEHIQNRAADILITDLDMPEMTGLELIEKLRERPQECPTFSFLLTASHVPGLKIAARRLMVTEVLSKPIHPQQVCQIVKQALGELDQSKSNPGFNAGEKKILIADDQPANVTLLSRYLDAEGYVYVTAADGPETLKQIGHEFPDLVLLDVNMPWKDGFTVLHEIRANPATQHIPVIMISAAWDTAAEIHQNRNVSPDDYVTKPIDRRELLSRIRKILFTKEALQSGITRKAM